VLALSRLVVAPSEPKNAATMLLGRTTRDAMTDRRWNLFVTYADARLGHKGTIYLATGWTPDGETEPTYGWVMGGRLVSRLSTKTRLFDEMRALGAVRVRSVKARFIKLKLR